MNRMEKYSQADLNNSFAHNCINKCSCYNICESICYIPKPYIEFSELFNFI
jgi:hypothetical protein